MIARDTEIYFSATKKVTELAIIMIYLFQQLWFFRGGGGAITLPIS